MASPVTRYQLSGERNGGREGGREGEREEGRMCVEL